MPNGRCDAGCAGCLAADSVRLSLLLSGAAAVSHTHSRSTELASNGTAVAVTAADDSTAPAAVWMADAQSAECVLCCRAFTLMLRRHHW